MAEPRKLLAALGSIRLAMALMALGMVLVLAGTLAQVDRDLWTVQRAYFRSWFVYVDFWRVWLPGGWLVGTAMLVNLAAATARRPLNLSPRHLGPFLGHAAIALFLVGELATGLLARETTMEITEGETARYSFSTREVELALVDTSPATHDQVTAIPAELLRPGAALAAPGLPFTVEPLRWLPSSTLVAAPAGVPPLATVGPGTRWTAVAAAATADGVALPSAWVRLRRGQEDLGTLLVSVSLAEPQRVLVDGREYQVALRFARFYEEFSLTLEDFAHDRYTGTQVARNFSSRLRLVDPGRNEDRQVLISMNAPLRHRGAAFYQSAYKDGDRTTVLQVVRNPGWTLPYVALGLGTLGMGLFFGQALLRSIRQRWSVPS